MASSYVTYTGNGAQTQYNVTFPFISRSHVKAYLAGVLTSAFTWISDSLIQFNSAPGNGVAIKITRETPTTPLTDFVDGATLTDDNLDNGLLQSLYVSEEAADRANDALNLDTAGTVWDAESKKIDNVAEPTASDHAATKNYVDTAVTGMGNVPAAANPGDNNKFLRANSGSWSWVTFLKSMISDATSFALTWLGLADAAAGRTTLGLGTAAVKNTGTSGDAVPVLNDAGGLQFAGPVGVGGAPVTQSKLTVTGSLSVNGSDTNFAAGGNRALLDIAGGAVRVGAINGGGAAFNEVQVFVNNGVAGRFGPSGFKMEGATGSIPTGGIINAAGYQVNGVTLGTVSVAILQDQKANGTDGGSSTSGAREVRILNTEVSDPDGIVSLPGSNQFRLQAGKYKITAITNYCVQGGNYVQTWIRDVTNSADRGISTNMAGGTAGSVAQHVYCIADAFVDIAGQTDYQIEGRCSLSVATFGFGAASSFSDGVEVYNTVIIEKLA